MKKLALVFATLSVFAFGCDGASSGPEETPSGSPGGKTDDTSSGRPHSMCEAGNVIRGDYFDLMQCVSTQQPLDQLVLYTREWNGPSGAGGVAPTQTRVTLNSQVAVVDMTCRTDVSGSNGGTTECHVAIGNADFSSKAADTEVVLPGLFTYSRRDDNSILNAWDVRLEFLGWDGSVLAETTQRFEEQAL
jgi:hypothetical protein